MSELSKVLNKIKKSKPLVVAKDNAVNILSGNIGAIVADVLTSDSEDKKELLQKAVSGELVKNDVKVAIDGIVAQTVMNLSPMSSYNPFTSRKWLLNIGFAVVVAVNAFFNHFMNMNDLILIASVTVGYMGVEGVRDIVGTKNTVNTVNTATIESEGE